MNNFSLPILVSFLLLSGTIFSNCAESSGSGLNISYGETARSVYDKGMAKYNDEDYIEAMKYFSYVKSKFPYSQYATLAELALGDSYFAQEKFIEAVDTYKMFIKIHPTHPKTIAGYPAFKICKAYVEQIPSDFFIVPPSHEKDQGATHDAVRELKIFMKTYPNSEHLADATKLYREGLRKLAAHELYVANFYLGRNKPRATIMRLEGLLKKYPDAGVDPEVMLLLGRTYLKLNERDKAKQTFADLMVKYPGDPQSAKAQLYLNYINGQRSE